MRSRAFSLVELLTAIGIVALLIGLVLPTLARTRDKGRSTVCLSNIRSCGQVSLMFAADHDGWLSVGSSQPGFDTLINPDAAPKTWVEHLAPYWDEQEGALICPSDKSPHFETPEPVTGRLRDSSYVVNGMLWYGDRWRPRSDGGIDLHLASVKRPTYVVLLGERIGGTPLAVIDLIVVEQPGHEDGQEGLGIDDEPQISIDLHGDGSNYAFLDGHAALHPWEQLMKRDRVPNNGRVWEINRLNPLFGR